MRNKHVRVPSWDGLIGRREQDLGGQLRRAGSLRLPSASSSNAEITDESRMIDISSGDKKNNENSSSSVRRGSNWSISRSSPLPSERRNHLEVPKDRPRSQQLFQESRSSTGVRIPPDPILSSSRSSSPVRSASSSIRFRSRHHSPAIDAPAPEYLARSLLQLGCPVVSMPKPRGGVGSELQQHHQQHSSDSDDSTSSHHGHHHHQQLQQQQQHQTQQQLQQQIQQQLQQQQSCHGQIQGQGQGHSQGQQGTMDGYGLPKVQVSGPPNTPESSFHNGSAGSIGARSAPSTPLQGVQGTPQQHQLQSQLQQQQQLQLHQQQLQQQQQQQQITGSQLTVASSSQSSSSYHSPPPKSPSHAALRCNDSQLSKPLSRSTPSMSAGVAQSPATHATGNTSSSRFSTRSSPTATSSARQKKFHRHFSQVAADERVLNYYSCALVGDILLQGHLYITPNYFAFYSNVFGYVTKLLIPTASVRKISKEKTARIIPNAVAVATEDERHVFCSLLSRDSTFKLMKQVWDAAIEARDPVVDTLPLPVEGKLLTPDPSIVDDSEVNPEEDDSSMSESGTDLNSRPPTICTDTDGVTPSIPRLSLPSSRLEQLSMPKVVLPSPKNNGGALRSLIWCELRPGTIIAILVGLLAALYVSAALMMVRIDRLHTAYLNHPLASPERYTQDRLLQYLTTNLDQIVKVRQSLQTLSQQFVTMSQDSDSVPSVSGGSIEPEESPS